MRAQRRGSVRAVARLTKAASAAVIFTFVAAPGLGHAAAPDPACIDRKVADGMARPQAIAECLREARDETSASTTTADRPSTTTSATSSDDDDGTSVGVLLGAGAVGLVVGAVGMGLIVQRGGKRSAPATPPASAPTFASPPPAGAPPPSIAPPPPERAQGLIVGLIELADRVPSQALRAEILATLGRADVHALDVSSGEAFDPIRMRGVGGTPTADASLVGRVATTERSGFRDGSRVIRIPEVLVYTAPG